MTFQGKIHNGMVVFDGNPQLAEGTPVTVVVDKPKSVAQKTEKDQMSEDHRRRLLAALNSAAAMPNENPGDTFSGRDHDQALYGEP
jgi:hypothetical protein